MATLDDIDSAHFEQRPPLDLPKLQQCLTSDLKAKNNHKEAMQSGHLQLGEGFISRDHLGLLDAGALSQYNNCFHAICL